MPSHTQMHIFKKSKIQKQHNKQLHYMLHSTQVFYQLCKFHVKQLACLYAKCSCHI